jgi:hypothetical protein
MPPSHHEELRATNNTHALKQSPRPLYPALRFTLSPYKLYDCRKICCQLVRESVSFDFLRAATGFVLELRLLLQHILTPCSCWRVLAGPGACVLRFAATQDPDNVVTLPCAAHARIWHATACPFSAFIVLICSPADYAWALLLLSKVLLLLGWHLSTHFK